MKKYVFIIAILVLGSCQTIKIKEKTYKITHSTTELASVGLSKNTILKNTFSTRVLPVITTKIRVNVEIVPFTKKIYNLYLKKGLYNLNNPKINYTDSISSKPELLILSLFDILGYKNELHLDENKEALTFIKDTKKAKVITSIATTLSTENSNKIKQADSYYLYNNQDDKYTLILYKSNKKIDTIDLQSGVILGYQLSKFCWSINNKGKWSLADIIENCSSCQGNTYSNTNEEHTNKKLSKM